MAQANSFASSLAAVPLAVRSPYLSTWMPSYNTPNGTQLVNKWPQFWAQETNPVSRNSLLHHFSMIFTPLQTNILGWAGHIRIDGLTYRWFGQAPGFTATNITSTSLTPTRTIYTVQAGPMNLTVTFFTPIEVIILSPLAPFHTALTPSCPAARLGSPVYAVLLFGPRGIVHRWQ